MEPQASEQDADNLVRLGGWLFKRRSWLPLPIAGVLLLTPSPPLRLTHWTLGAALVAAGEALRLWGVHHIGVISRTRSDRLGPLVASGPFARVRNPLYLGNVALWVGFAISAGLAWLAPIVAALLAFEYHAIVRWEERLLEARLGEPYRQYVGRVPRWVPSTASAAGTADAHIGSSSPFSWRDTLFSERSTLIAIVLGYLLLWAKTRI